LQKRAPVDRIRLTDRQHKNSFSNEAVFVVLQLWDERIYHRESETTMLREDTMAHKPILLPLTIPHCTGILVPNKLFTTSEGKLRVEGVCSQCKKALYQEFLPSELARRCPKPQVSEEETPDWMKEMHVVLQAS
jgi:hypothetical protein